MKSLLKSQNIMDSPIDNIDIFNMYLYKYACVYIFTFIYVNVLGAPYS